MPIYEYRCTECQQVFEEWIKQVEADTAQHACPICRGTAKRIMSNTSFALKGTGWYTTDYGSRKNDPSESPKSDPGVSATSPSPAVEAAPAAAPVGPPPVA